ncbi:histidine triad nucleotide-binding protein [Oceanivirga salmonicida]|uniref:histidine triad nucleotide-binding protein n=1 Tax=Oceanivirga salmonicida TaxID=1769291 RepID=UPI0008301DCB|nr:histidine triad nucleotide-binding protein [Oceanivirga salmonicida]
MSTIFKKIIDKEIPAKVVYEDNEIMAFHDIAPIAPVHIIVIPKKEIASLNFADETDALLLGKIQLVIAKLAREFKINESGYRVVSNIGKDGGQTVNHIHYHLIGGRKLGTEM